MQFSTVFVASLLAVTSLATPVAIPQEAAADIDFAELGNIAHAQVDTAALDLSREQCATACKGGVTAAKAFCNLVPNPIAKAACKIAAAAAGTGPGQDACVSFCDKFF